MASCNCSIVILAHNGADFTETCLGSLLRGDDRPRELFVVDNGSSDRTPGVLAAFAPRFEEAGVRFVTWRNTENKGCSAARNDAWEKATSRYVLFMDNDTAVCTRTWLSRLEALLEGDPQIGLAGPKMIYPLKPHPIQCAGVAINPMGRICFCGRGAARCDPRFGEARSVHTLISACWIMRNDLRESVGLLDELFHPVQYEDLDLCLRAREAGYDVRYSSDVEMYHFEGITTASLGQMEYQRNIARNSAKFRQKWHTTFKALPADPTATEYRWLSRAELGLTPEQELTLCG